MRPFLIHSRPNHLATGSTPQSPRPADLDTEDGRNTIAAMTAKHKSASPAPSSPAPSSLKPGPYQIWDLYDATRQTTHWKTKDGRILALAEMGTDHLVKVALHLQNARYRVLAFEEARYLLQGDTGAPWIGYDDNQWYWNQILESDPDAWLRETPLWRALLAELERRGVRQLPPQGEETSTPEGLRNEAWTAIVRPIMLRPRQR